MTRQEQPKAVYLKTYGRQIRKLPAWISPHTRKGVFDSSRTTDGDDSVFEPAKVRRKKANSKGKAVRPTRRKAKENIDSPIHQHALQGKITRRRKAVSVASPAAVRRKRRPRQTTSESEDDMAFSIRSHPNPLQVNTSLKKRKAVSVAAVRRKRRPHQTTSESEDDMAFSIRSHPNPLQVNTSLNIPGPSVSRFVTCRQRLVSKKPKLKKATAVDSSEDYTSREHKKSTTPPKRKRLESSMDSSNSSMAALPLQENLLNESADHNLRPCSRKPIFCSTPSVCPARKGLDRVPVAITNQSLNSLSLSVSCIGVSTLKEDLGQPRQPCSSPPSENTEQKNQAGQSFHHGYSFDLFAHPVSVNQTGRCFKTNTFSESVPTPESSSCFEVPMKDISSPAEALKQKCLAEDCNVRVKRLDLLTVSRLRRQTVYFSCSDLLSSAGTKPTAEPVCVDLLSSPQPSFDANDRESETSCVPINPSLSPQALSPQPSFDANDGESESSCVLTNPSLSPQALSPQPSFDANDGESESSCVLTNPSLSPQALSPQPSFDANDRESETSCVLTNPSLSPQALSSEDESMERSASVRIVESSQLTDSSFELFTCPELTTDFSVQRSTEKKGIDGSFGKECKVSVKRLDMSQFKTGLVHRKTSAAQLGNDEDAVDTQSEEDSLKMALIQKCQSDKLAVRIRRMTLAQLKELQGKVAKSDSLSNAPDSTGGVVTTTRDSQEISSVALEKQSSGFGTVVAPGKEVQDPGVAAKRKKKKKKSPLTGRPGTTRKACVSGLSVSRWKSDSRIQTPHRFRRRKAADCTMDDLVSAQTKELHDLLGHTNNFSTPVRTCPLNLSSLLTDFTPHTQYWNRLKSALSIHRKVMVTPSNHKTPGPADISQLMSDVDLSDAEKVYAECGQPGPLPWTQCISPQRMKQCVKIGEGTFGEVFSTSNASGEVVALKVIPVEGSEKVNEEDQKTLGEILHEIIISKELSSLKDKQQNQTSSFIGLKDLHCVRGCYPPEFLKAWDTFDQKKGSENDRPDFFKKDQLFIILEFEFGGVDLENSNGTLSSLAVAKSILHQVTAALAVAEQQLHFEHRDLHWGNVLVKTTKDKTGNFLLNGTAHSMETKGVLVRIIDYSLSRLEIDGLRVSCDISNDEELFLGQGDYQFDIYRLMREENGNDWNSYQPHSNVLWLHYLCSKLLAMRYRSKGGRGAKETKKELTHFYQNILQYRCATEALQTCPLFH
ncbi:uncharacterized protein haspin [Nerophis ophidion]|uniref:uncharacterized protein haspin n=1 Tax=Nerophis ophidion TaxID=159077 RepID=UPI002AE085CF|nr:uncharacterized protein haspin [Nerophis ophidion]